MAVTKGMVSERLEILKDAGIDPQIITLDALALLDFYVNRFDFSGEATTVLVRLSHEGSFLGFLKGERLTGYRNLEGISLSDAAAEQKIVKEIHRSVLSCQSSDTADAEIGSICVAGPNADRFRSLLQERFPDLPIRIVEFNGNSLAEIPPYLMASVDDYQLAIALAHAGIGNARNLVNFRRDEFAPAPILSRIKPNIYFSLTILLVAVFAWYASLTASNRFQERRLKLLNQEMVQAFADKLPVLKSPENVQEKIREEQERFKLLKNYSSEYVPPLDVLAEVTASIPQGKTITLNDLAISDYTLRMTGDVNSFDDINIFRDNLEGASLLSEVKIESATKADKGDKITFRIRANIGRQAQNSPAEPDTTHDTIKKT
jgi:Tfp pilus assembly protein PilN